MSRRHYIITVSYDDMQLSGYTITLSEWIPPSIPVFRYCINRPIALISSSSADEKMMDINTF